MAARPNDAQPNVYKPLEVYIGLRYTRAKRRNHFVSFISVMSTLGVALGIAALVTVLSVMNGFEKTLYSHILGMTSHATVVQPGQPLADWKQVAGLLRKETKIRGVAPFVDAQAMLTHGGNARGVLIRGIVPELEHEVSMVSERIESGSLGSLTAGSFNIVLGHTLAKDLNVQVSDKIGFIAPQTNGRHGANLTPLLKQFTVTGIFKVGMHEYDKGVAYIHMDSAARLFKLGRGVTGLRMNTDDPFRAPLTSREIVSRLPGYFAVIDWTQHHTNFFRALKGQKTMMFLILTLIVAVAAFNIVSTLVMVVADKESDIAILRTLGISPRVVMRIFIVQGTAIGIVGTLLGVVSGIYLAQNVETIVPAIEALLNTKFISPDVYHIDYLPSELRWPDITVIALVAFILCVSATLYPAWRAARTQPSEVLRYR